ncbi:MAG: PP0621 family protein [Thiotrichaceae bacterium]
MNYLIRIAVISFVVFILWSMATSRGSTNRGGKQRPSPQLTPEGKKTKLKMRCDECGVHFPQEESVMVGKKVFCCEEHKKKSLQRLS